MGLLVSEPESFAGYTLFSKEDSVNGANAYLIDHQGRLVHQWPMRRHSNPVELLPNGNLFGGSQGAREIGPNGAVLWGCSRHQHHDLLKLPNGNVVLLGDRRLTREAAVAAGANPDLVDDAGLRGTRLIEFQPDDASCGEIVWEWSVFDHLIQDFDPSKPNYGAVEEHPELVDLNFALTNPTALLPNDANVRGAGDWHHPNSLDYNAELDQIMISVRHFSEVWIIDHSASAEEAAGHSGGNAGKGGDLLYRWGNPRAYRAGTEADQRLFWQHDAHWIPEGLPGAGNMLVFNNGAERAVQRRRLHSSVDEIALPAEGWNYRMEPGSAYGPSAPLWTYAADHPPDFYSPTTSGAQRLPNGNTLITNGDSGAIFEVTPSGKKVWEYVNPVAHDGALRQGENPPKVRIRGGARLGNSLYRSYRYAPDYPGLQGLDLTPSGPIELPRAP